MYKGLIWKQRNDHCIGDRRRKFWNCSRLNSELELNLTMRNTRLQEVLQKLTKTQIKKFEDFLHSPYFNKKDTLAEFWAAVKPFAPAFEIADPDKEKIYWQLFKREYNDAYYRNLCSDMLQILLHFLMIENFEEDDLARHEHKLYALRNLKLLELMEKELIAAEKSLNQSTARYLSILRNKIWIHDFKKGVIILHHRTKLENVSTGILKLSISENEMDFALAKSFLNLINYHKASFLTRQPFDYTIADKLFQVYESGLCSDNIFVQAYYLLARLIIYRSVDNYFHLKKIVIDENALSNNADKENLIIGLMGFLTEEVEKNESLWRNEIFELYDYRLKNTFWELRGELAYTSIINTVQNALALHKMDYASEVVDKYAKHMNANIRQDVSNLCLAMIAFYQKKYDNAHTLLLSIQTENIVVKYELRILLAMIYFAKCDYITILSHLESFKHFISYNKSLVEFVNYDNTLKFCQYMMQITKLKLDPNKKNLQKIIGKMQADNFTAKNWLLEMMHT